MHPLQRGDHFLVVGLLALQPAQRRVAVGDDGRERLIDLVGDRRDQLAHRRQARHARQVGLGRRQRILGRLLRRDVLDDHRDARSLAVDDGNHRGADVGPEVAAVAPLVAFLLLVAAAPPLEQAIDVFARFRPFRGLGDVDQRNADDFLRTVAEHLLQRRIGLGDLAVGIGQRDADRRVLVEALPAALGNLQRAQSLAHGFAAGDQSGRQFADVGSLRIQFLLQNVDGPLDRDQVAHAGPQLLRREGLGQVILDEVLEQRPAQRVVGAGGQHQHRDVRGLAAAQFADEALAIHAGHHQVGDHQVRRAGVQRLQCQFAVLGQRHRVVVGQHVVEELAQVRVVLDDQDGGLSGLFRQPRRLAVAQPFDGLERQHPGAVAGPDEGAGRRAQRQLDLEQCAALGCVEHRDRAAMQFDELLDDVEPEALPLDDSSSSPWA
jgi:hypothetical protein